MVNKRVKIEKREHLSARHEWFREACMKLSDECAEHGRGVIVLPFSDPRLMALSAKSNDKELTASLFFCNMPEIAILPAFASGLDNLIQQAPELKPQLPALVDYIEQEIIGKE